MSDFETDFKAAYTGVIKDVRLGLMLEANDLIEGSIRVDTGANRMVIADWAPGHDGGDLDVASDRDHSVPGPDAAISANEAADAGEGVSASVPTDHAFWTDVDHDGTLEEVAEILSS